MSMRFRERVLAVLEDHLVGDDLESLHELSDEDLHKVWFGLSPDKRSAALGTVFRDKSLADQSQAEEADINTIVRKFHLTGQLPVRSDDAKVREMAGDLEAMEGLTKFDLQAAMNRVNEARFAFDRLPLHVRKRFGYDPLEFSTAIADPEKGPQLAHELGLTVVVP